MKIQIELDPSLTDLQICIRSPEMNQEVENVQKLLTDYMQNKNRIVFYQQEKEYYFPIQKILFFETGENGLEAHTASDVFQVKYKLYELEAMVPAYFMRVSKSTILNTREVYSINRNLTSSSVVEFQKTHKKVYVSRNYYKALREVMSSR